MGSLSASSTLSAHMRPDEDWTTTTDFEERRRLQSRIAQRGYRQRQKQKKPSQGSIDSGEGQYIDHSGAMMTEFSNGHMTPLELSAGNSHSRMPYNNGSATANTVPRNSSRTGCALSPLQHQAFTVPTLPTPQPSPPSPIHLVEDTAFWSQFDTTTPRYSVSHTPVAETLRPQHAVAMTAQQCTPPLMSPPPSYMPTWDVEPMEDTFSGTGQQQYPCSTHNVAFGLSSPHRHEASQQYNVFSRPHSHHSSITHSACWCPQCSDASSHHSHYGAHQQREYGHHIPQGSYIGSIAPRPTYGVLGGRYDRPPISHPIPNPCLTCGSQHYVHRLQPPPPPPPPSSQGCCCGQGCASHWSAPLQ